MTADAPMGSAPSPTGPLSTIDYSERIPNNVNLAGDRRLQRALEGWQPKFLDWWKTLGPMYRFGGDFQTRDYNHFSISPDGKLA